MNTNEWKNRLETAIEREIAEPEFVDRLGRRPVTVLSDEIRNRHTTDPALIEAARRLLSTMPGDRGQPLAILVSLVDSAELYHDKLAGVIYRRLMTSDPDDAAIRVLWMNTLLDMKFRLAPSDLDALTDVRDTYPIQWVNAWMESGYPEKGLSFAEDNIRRGRIGALDLNISVDSWWQILGPELDRHIRNWHGLLEGDPDRDLLSEWMNSKGIPGREDESMGAGTISRRRETARSSPTGSVYNQLIPRSRDRKGKQAEQIRDVREILVVDDSPALLDDLKWAAEEASEADITEAQSAREAMDLIREHDFDLVITDLRMETQEAGMEVLTAAKNKDWNTQVILVTAFDRPRETDPTAIAKGAYGYIDRNGPGNYLQRLRQDIGPALARREQKRREGKAEG
uniref:Response regulator receiver domain-containing protein n=1 Tax=Candidatus Kentrum sp. FM TaxID=2126340 RepID=A0A450SP62_9GAMM|nr:MAG: Response regulator receiver domain-containing protein [Candidatus Kentron sp. FM]VFJ55676.1 MAG: Response regulator receiver domain-containing protein [Candidatus Kentron sp. FM]VFK10778.1 MAG: Response regulator receiver domain-containing protein [Candidatus Kentron sp. FM]